MNAQETRYDRQILLPEIGLEGQRKLAKARVLLVGCGGLGAPIATYLAAAGVGTLGLVDDDVVSLTNLHRQVLFSELQVGQPKVVCARERLTQLNGEVNIKVYPVRLSAENALAILSGYDIVVDGTDNFAARFLISDTCLSLSLPFVYGSIRGLQGQVAVLCVGRATYRTLFPDETATLSMPHPGKEVVGVTPSVVGSVEASQAIQLICGYGEPLIDRLWTVDLATMQSHIIDL
ncbi:MAG: HesA/MoeB/ThiF family protein [Prevotellaceae bacterium]|nr:HesA/MoeB/ThiF family protein [Prevotellaceae bacterium]